MSYSGDFLIDNSFTLTIRNVSSKRQRIAMFELGSGDPNAVLTTQGYTASEPNLVNKSFIFGFSLLNIGVDDTISIDATFDVEFGINGTIFTLAGSFGAGNTLQSIVDEINKQLAINVNARWLRINMAGVMDSFGTLKDNQVYLSLTYLTADPLTGSIAGYFTGNPADSGNVQLLDNITLKNFSTGDSDVSQINTNTYPLTETTTANNGAIEFVPNGLVPYGQILESQNGQVLDIKAMRIDALPNPRQSGTSTFIDAQLLEPLKFSKKDATGNDLRYNKIPTIDPYQFQKSIDFIDMNTKADTFALDGTTKFSCGIQPYITLRLSCDYTSITNLVADTQYAQEIEQKEDDKIKAQMEEGDNRRTYKADIPAPIIASIEQENKEFDKDIEKKKIFYKIYYNNQLLHGTSSFSWGAWS